MRWRSSSSPCSVILGNVRSVVLVSMDGFLLLNCLLLVCFALAQHLAVDLAGRGLRQFRDKADEARIFVMTEALAHEVLDLVLRSARRPPDRRRRMPSPPARAADRARRSRPLRAPRGCLRMASSISTALMVQPAEMMTSSARLPSIEIAVLVGASEILDRDPLAAPPDFQFADTPGAHGCPSRLGPRRGRREWACPASPA